MSEYKRLHELMDGFKTEESKGKTEANLVVAGIFGLVDPLRDGIKAAVERCHKSGINVRMCTGDNIDTATAISMEAGIITRADMLNNEAGYLCMTGEQFRTAVGGLVEIADPKDKDKKIQQVANKKSFQGHPERFTCARSLLARRQISPSDWAKRT